MSIFGRSQKVAAQSVVTAPVFEGYDVEVNGDILALQESWEDQLAVIEALHSLDMEEISLRSDIKTLQESSASESEIEARYEQFETVTESAVGNAWAKLKKFFADLWGKLRAFFDSVVRVFDGIFKSAESFVKKYEPQLKKLNLRGFKYKMYNYTNIDEVKLLDVDKIKGETEALYAEATKAGISGYTEKALEQLDKRVQALRENKEDELDKYRGGIVGQGSVSDKQFGQALFSEFRGGAKSKEDEVEREINIDEIIASIKGAGAAKEKAVAFKKAVDEEFTKIIKDIDAVSTKIKTTAPEGGHVKVDLGEGEAGGTRRVKADGVNKVLDALRVYSGIFSAKKSIQLTVFRAWQTAWKERNSTYKSVCTSAFRYKADK